jgi:hypothetical protein
MNKHLTDGQLRAALDNELDSNGLAHLEACLDCQTRQKTIQTHSSLVADKLSFLTSSTKDSHLPASTAWQRFNQQKLNRKETSMFKKIFASPLIRYGLPTVLAITVIFAVPSVRAFASELLNLFRVQQVRVVQVDYTGMEQLNGSFGNQIGELISDSIVMTQKPGDPVEVSDASQASKLTGFTVRVPQNMTPSRISVMSASAFSLTIDRARAQALLNEAGRSDLVLPESVDGADISVTIPASVSVGYGNCPLPSKDSDGLGMDEAGSPGRRYADCVILAEIPSPSVSAPASLDIEQLAQIGLEFTGMTSEQAAAFTSTVDWTSTLVIPLPKNAALYEQIPVDGVTGTLIQRPSDDAPQFALIWVKDGIIYTVGGLGSDSQKAIDIANSLP